MDQDNALLAQLNVIARTRSQLNDAKEEVKWLKQEIKDGEDALETLRCRLNVQLEIERGELNADRKAMGGMRVVSADQ